MTDARRAENLERYRRELRTEFEARFSASRAYYERVGDRVLDFTSHAVRWSDPFMPVTRRASGAVVEYVDGSSAIDYWQGHFANLLGHNPESVRRALAETLADGRGLQSGMVHRVEGELAETLCRLTGAETVRLTTSGSLGTFYAALLARAFTGRSRVLKVAGGWHGSQPFGMKGVSAHGVSFDHLESEGISREAGEEIVLSRFNDVDDLRETFRRDGDTIACFLLEPVLGAGGGMVADAEYLREARRLTERHGALLACDEIITGFRFRPGDAGSAYGVRPDLMILGKVIGGGMPVAAVAGRREVMHLCSRECGRVKFEGGTYSAHELSLVASLTMLREIETRAATIYPALAAIGARLRGEVAAVCRRAGLPVFVLGEPDGLLGGSSLAWIHPAADDGPPPRCPEELARRRHPLIDGGLLRSTLLLEGLSVRYGVGAASTAHDDGHVDRTVAAYEAGLARLVRAGLL